MRTPSERIDHFLSKQQNFGMLLSERNDRSAAIRTSALIEESLTFILQVYFDASSATEKRGVGQTSRLMADLFEGFGPLSTFSGKILLFDALGLLSPAARHDLQLIKKIRNSFAHESILLDFATPDIAQRCDNLILWKSAKVIIEGLNLTLSSKVKFVLTGIVLMLELMKASKINLDLFKAIVPMGEETLGDWFGDLSIIQR